MTAPPQTVDPTWPVFSVIVPQLSLWVGAPAAIACACLYGLPLHAVVSLYVMLHVGGFGITMGFHRLFCHRSFEAPRPVEWALMICGCVGGESSPCFWVAGHRRHHRHSDRAGDPHSPHTGTKVWWRRFWHAHVGWTLTPPTYEPAVVRDLTRRPDLMWIERRYPLWYLLGLLPAAAAGYLIGGTAYDALIGFLWGGPLRHAISLQATFFINSAGHLLGSRAHDTGDHSRNSAVLAVFTLGEGWHNNHHAHPYSARHGFYWWQPDVTWTAIWCLEKLGVVWNVKRPKLDPPHAAPSPEPAETPFRSGTDA